MSRHRSVGGGLSLNFPLFMAKQVVFQVQMTLSYNMQVWPWSVAMSDSSNLVRGTLYIVFCSFVVKNTHWTKGWKCLWRGHSVNQNRALLSLQASSEAAVFVTMYCVGMGLSVGTDRWTFQRSMAKQVVKGGSARR